MIKLAVLIFCVVCFAKSNVIINTETLEADIADSSNETLSVVEDNQENSVELFCTYGKNTGWWAINYAYFCEQDFDMVVESPITKISKVNGIHWDGKSNTDVLGFRINDKLMKFFPKGLENFFGNLEFLAIWTTNLQEIHSNDLAPFTKLRVLSIWETQIEYLEKDLLKSNSEIEYIGFGKNRIKFVDPTVFKSLSFLHTLHFDGNECYSKQVAGNRREVAKLVEEITEHCASNEV